LTFTKATDRVGQTTGMMSCVPSPTYNAGVRHILTLDPEVGRAFAAFLCAAFRNASSLEPAHEDLRAASVSGLKGNHGMSNTRGQALCDTDHEPLMARFNAATTLELPA
jgi:hypothetical protein